MQCILLSACAINQCLVAGSTALCGSAQQVSCLDPADIKLLAPVMTSPILRQLLISLRNDTTAAPTSSSSSSSGLQSWVSNPRVVQLLRQAVKALRQGKLTEQQLAALLQQQHKVGATAVVRQVTYTVH